MDLRTWQTLAEPKHERLIALAAEVDPTNVAQVDKLRREGERELVGAALDLAAARRKAVAKFGAKRAATLWADPAGVEMATSRMVADYKQDRFFLYLPGWPLADVCCGIGGDAMAFVADNEVVAVDRDPVRAWMASMNAGCRVVVAEAEEFETPDGLVHIDPSRRDEARGTRSWRLDDLRPTIHSVQAIVNRHRWGGAVKLGPGANLEEVAAAFPGGQIEIISENGSLVQCVVWIGLGVGPGMRSATLLRGGPDDPYEERLKKKHRLNGDPVAVVEPDEARTEARFKALRFLYEPDDSVERAGLLATLCERVGAPMLHPRVGLLTSDARIESPWLTTFEVLEEMAWNEKRVKAVLDARRAGIVEVKTRGGVVEPDALQGRLRGKWDERLTVFVLRLGREIRAIVARRVA